MKHVLRIFGRYERMHAYLRDLEPGPGERVYYSTGRIERPGRVETCAVLNCQEDYRRLAGIVVHEVINESASIEAEQWARLRIRPQQEKP